MLQTDCFRLWQPPPGVHPDCRREGGPLHTPGGTPYTPGILYEYQKKGVVKFAFRK